MLACADESERDGLAEKLEREGHEVIGLLPSELGEALLIIGELGLRPADRVILCTGASSVPRVVATTVYMAGREAISVDAHVGGGGADRRR